jgi:hypothetical protein
VGRRRRKETRRTIGTLTPQDHSNRRLVIILALTGVGLVALFGLAYIVARLDVENFDKQETPPTPEQSQHNP